MPLETAFADITARLRQGKFPNERANDPKPAGKWIERFEEWLADSGFLKKP